MEQTVDMLGIYNTTKLIYRFIDEYTNDPWDMQGLFCGCAQPMRDDATM